MNEPARDRSPRDMRTDRILLVGPGRVGSTLAVALGRAGWPIEGVAGRSIEACGRLASRIGTTVSIFSLDGRTHADQADRHGIDAGPAETGAAVLPGFDVTLLAVADDAIEPVCAEVAARGLIASDGVVLHLSGSRTHESLGAAARLGASTGSMHPLQTFPDLSSGLRDLPGSHWFIEGDEPAVALAVRIVEALEGRAHVLEPGAKVLYHASASIAANLLTALLDASLQVGAAAGLDRHEMMQALAPLLRATLEAAVDRGAPASLTGPVSRGDVDTVRMHLEAIAGIEGLPELYRVLGRRSVRMALEAGQIDEATAARLAGLLA